MKNSTERFTSRVENYFRYRPRYPRAVAECLQRECGLTTEAVIADVGSGTGMLSELFLANGNTVFGVEPNAAMRGAAEALLANQALFLSRNGTAETTTLPAGCVDFVVAGQAFHWFDQKLARREFARILRPGGWVVLVWNERSATASPFDAAYERLLETFAVGYAIVNHRAIDANSLRTFFDHGFRMRTFANSQRFDFDGLKGRLLSSSYAPEAGHTEHESMIRTLHSIFDTNESDGHVTIHYDTNVYFGHVSGEAADSEAADSEAADSEAADGEAAHEPS